MKALFISTSDGYASASTLILAWHFSGLKCMKNNAILKEFIRDERTSIRRDGINEAAYRNGLNIFETTFFGTAQMVRRTLQSISEQRLLQSSPT